MPNLIFGYTFEEIQAAQQGMPLTRALPLAAQVAKEALCTSEDMDLFNKHGETGLKEKQFYGVIDRLVRAGIIGA